MKKPAIKTGALAMLLCFPLVFVFVSCAKPPEDRELKKTKDEIMITIDGVIVPRRSEKIISPIDGRIVRVNSAMGRRVFRGQRLIELDKFPEEQRYKDAIAQYRKALIAAEWKQKTNGARESRVVVDNAKDTLRRTYGLYRSGDATLGELKSAEDAYADAKAGYAKGKDSYETERSDARIRRQEDMENVEEARIAVESALHDLRNTGIASPIGGYITGFNAAAGQEVSAGETIGTVSDIHSVFFKGGFYPAMYRYIKKIGTAGISCMSEPPVHVKGRVTEISPIAGTSAGKPVLYIQLENSGFLLQPGMKCLATFVMTRKQARQAGLAAGNTKVQANSGTGTSKDNRWRH